MPARPCPFAARLPLTTLESLLKRRRVAGDKRRTARVLAGMLPPLYWARNVAESVAFDARHSRDGVGVLPYVDNPEDVQPLRFALQLQAAGRDGRVEWDADANTFRLTIPQSERCGWCREIRLH